MHLESIYQSLPQIPRFPCMPAVMGSSPPDCRYNHRQISWTQSPNSVPFFFFPPVLTCYKDFPDFQVYAQEELIAVTHWVLTRDPMPCHTLSIHYLSHLRGRYYFTSILPISRRSETWLVQGSHGSRWASWDWDRVCLMSQTLFLTIILSKQAQNPQTLLWSFPLRLPSQAQWAYLPTVVSSHCCFLCVIWGKCVRLLPWARCSLSGISQHREAGRITSVCRRQKPLTTVI